MEYDYFALMRLIFDLKLQLTMFFEVRDEM